MLPCYKYVCLLHSITDPNVSPFVFSSYINVSVYSSCISSFNSVAIHFRIIPLSHSVYPGFIFHSWPASLSPADVHGRHFNPRLDGEDKTSTLQVTTPPHKLPMAARRSPLHHSQANHRNFPTQGFERREKV